MNQPETGQDAGTTPEDGVTYQLSEEDHAALIEAVERVNREIAEAAPQLDDMRTLARFLPKVDMSGGPDACWPWTGAMSGAGYPQFRVDAASVGAHRLMCEFDTGERLQRLVARHGCGNSICVNPRHLAPGSQAQNAAEAIAHGTAPGLTDERVADLRNVIIARPALSYRELGDLFGIAESTAWVIGTGRSRNPLRGPTTHRRHAQRRS